MDINAKIIGQIIGKHLAENLSSTFTTKVMEDTTEIVYCGGWFRNKVVFGTACGEERATFFALDTNHHKWAETSSQKCGRFIDNPVFWAGYIANELMQRNDAD